VCTLQKGTERGGCSPNEFGGQKTGVWLGGVLKKGWDTTGVEEKGERGGGGHTEVNYSFGVWGKKMCGTCERGGGGGGGDPGGKRRAGCGVWFVRPPKKKKGCDRRTLS